MRSWSNTRSKNLYETRIGENGKENRFIVEHRPCRAQNKRGIESFNALARRVEGHRLA